MQATFYINLYRVTNYKRLPISATTFIALSFFVITLINCKIIQDDELHSSKLLMTPIIDTLTGPIQGSVVDYKYNRYAGIPYATPPIGELRFTKAKPAKNWNKVLQTTVLPPPCIQVSILNISAAIANEDCLFINVYTPKLAIKNDTKYAVMVWIHGGNFVIGSGSNYDPTTLISNSGDNIIVVTFNYRLGPFGFLSFGDTQFNNGIADQQLALKWIKENIAQFGGDPNNITLFGESAGGGSQAIHLVVKESWKYYDKVIMESPGPWWFRNTTQTIEKSIKLARSFGCGTINNDNSSSIHNSDNINNELLNCLRKIPANKIATSKISDDISVTIGTKELAQQLITMLNTNATNNIKPNVKIIIGLNEYEGDLFVYWIFGSKKEISNIKYTILLKAIFQPFGLYKFVNTTYSDYRLKYGNWHALAEAIGDFTLSCGTIITTNSTFNIRDTYYYVFTHKSKYSKYGLNATHTSELPYVFEKFHKLDSDEQHLAYTIEKYWSNFAKYGNPNDDVNPHWPKYSPTSTSNTILMLDTNITLSKSFHKAYCDLWRARWFLPPNK